MQYQGEFRYLDIQGNDMSQIEKIIDLPEQVQAPINAGEQAGVARYLLGGTEIGNIPILFAEDIRKAGFGDYLQKILGFFLL